jgi:hypothetical protein
MSDHLASLERTGLDPRWRVLPAGGAINIPTFVALVGPALDVTVLVDGAEFGSQRIQNLVKADLLAGSRLLTPGIATNAKNADIEDVFAESDYLNVYNAAFGKSLSHTVLTGNDGIVKRIERAAESFDHNKPARFLLHNRDTALASMSDETFDRFEALFVAINATLR